MGDASDQASASKWSVPPLDEEMKFILGRPCFTFVGLAEVYRAAGHDIGRRAEEEQAFFIHRWLTFYAAHGSEWRVFAGQDIERHQTPIEENENG